MTLDLDAIRACNEERRRLKAAASKGPWRKGSLGGHCVLDHGPDKRHGQGECDYRVVWYDSTGDIYIDALKEGDPSPKDSTDLMIAGMWECDCGGLQYAHDADFVVHARNDPVETDVDALLAEVERLYAHPLVKAMLPQPPPEDCPRRDCIPVTPPFPS